MSYMIGPLLPNKVKEFAAKHLNTKCLSRNIDLIYTEALSPNELAYFNIYLDCSDNEPMIYVEITAYGDYRSAIDAGLGSEWERTIGKMIRFAHGNEFMSEPFSNVWETITKDFFAAILPELWAQRPVFDLDEAITLLIKARGSFLI